MIDVSVTVERIVSQRFGGCIFAGRLPDAAAIRIVAASGLLGAAPVPGEVWRVRGHSEDSAWGQQVRAENLWRAAPSGKLIGEWVIANVPGVGRARTARLMAAFGHELVEMLDRGDPEPLADTLAPGYPNLGLRLAGSLISAWAEQRAVADLHTWLDRHGVQEPRLARRIAALLGDGAVAALEQNPYTLVGLLPWLQVDALGLRLLAENADRNRNPALDARRLVGVIDAVVIERITEYGDTAVTDDRLKRRIADLLFSSVGAGDLACAISEAVRLAALNHAIVADGDGAWRAPGCALMETLLAKRINDLVRGPWRSSVHLATPDSRRRYLEAACEQEGIVLHLEQKVACSALLGLPFGILTGGAGVGKTTATRAIAASWEKAGGRVELCALSGKAARRLGQATGRLARTIFRLIRDLRRRQEDPTTAIVDGEIANLDDRTLLVVDEASMVDLGQFTELLVDHLPEGCHVLLVGDPAQLPPIGPGLVFPVLCGLPGIVAALTVVHRQTGTSGIPPVSAAVRDGRIPSLPTFDRECLGGVCVLECKPQDVAAQVMRVVAALGGHGSAGHNLMILSPTNNGAACSVRQMNRAFQALRLQADGWSEDTALLGAWGQQFVPGDPVVYTRNLYREGLFNGMLGRVEAIDRPEQRLTVRFEDGEVVQIDGEKLADVQLAYALSCHKAQGSSARRIVVPVYRSRVFDRAWVYTAITRAEEICVLVGDMAVLRAAIADPPSASRRMHRFLAKGPPDVSGLI